MLLNLMAETIRMACCPNEEARAQRRINKQIDHQLRRYERHARKEVKVLLLGTGESGKSTFLKQTRIIHGTGYTKSERRALIRSIHENVLLAVRILIAAMERFEISYQLPENFELAQKIANAESLQPSHIEMITTLWVDKGIQTCYARRREFHLADSAAYYLAALDRLSADDYLPTEQDIVRVRVPTTGIVEYPFQVSTNTIRLVDVGGQRTERRKWIHCFESVTSIIFIVALSEYDQFLFEQHQVNRMEESLALFETIITNTILREPSIILFLNKRDIFDEKIATSHLADYFPRYTGPRGEPEPARRFIMDMFHACNGDDERRIYTQFTTATDTENIRFVWKAVKDTVLHRNISDYCVF